MTGLESGWVQVGIGCAVWIGTLALAWGRFGGRIDILDMRMKSMEDSNRIIAEALREFNKNDKELALLRSDHAALQKDFSTLYETVEKMRRGEGYIQGPRRANIDGEYPARSVG